MIFKFISFLERRNIDYLILNGYEDIYNDKSDSDIDILFKKDNFKRIEDTVKAVCEEENWMLVQIYHQDTWAKNIFLFDLKSHEILNLDTYGYLSRMKVPIFSEEELFKKGTVFKNIKTLNSDHELIYYLSKKLDKNDLYVDKFEVLRRLFISNTEECKLALQEYFPTTYTIIERSFINDELEIINRELLIKDFQKKTEYRAYDFYKNSIRVLKRIIKPTGFSLTFLGPDGSGKSTIIELLKQSNLPFRQTKYFHLKPINTNNNTTQIINPHEKPKYNSLKSYVKLVYLIFQYNLGWVKNIIPLKIKSTLVIFDRYYDDLLVDTKRYRYGGNMLLAKMVKKVIPKPNVYFVLTTSPQIIYDRKKEVSFQELERQIHAYKALTKNKKYYAIDASKSPEEITTHVISIIMQNMSKRYS